MGYYSTFTVIYKGDNTEPVLDAVLNALPGTEFNVRSYENGFDTNFIDSRSNSEEVSELLGSVAVEFNTTFAIVFEDDFEQFTFYVGAEAEIRKLDSRLNQLKGLLVSINDYSNEAIMEVAQRDPERLGYILNALDTLDAILRTPTEPVL